MKEIKDFPRNTEKEVLSILKDNPIVFIAFINPNCHHCDMFKPVYSKACNDLDTKNATLMNVHSDNLPVLKTTFREFNKVDGVPTLFSKKGKKFSMYKGDNDYDSLKQFISSNINSNQSGGKSKKKLKKHKKYNKTKKKKKS